MEFWIVFFCSSLFIYLISIKIEPVYQKYIAFAYIFFIWFIGAFRKNIGTDYSTYEYMYDIWLVDENIEPTFSFIVAVLHELDFHSQMLFVVYESIIVLFLYLGAKRYLWHSFGTFIFMLLYVVFPTDGGYWWDLNCIRQAAAISVVFYGSSFLNKKKYVIFSILLILTCMFHYSAIIFLVLPFLDKGKISFKFVFALLALGFVFNATGITARIVMECAAIVTNFVGKYEYDVFTAISGTASFSITAGYFSFLYIASVYYLRRKNIPILIMNGASIYILLRVYMSFGIEDSLFRHVVHRFEAYFVPFFLLLMVMAMVHLIRELRSRWQAVLITSMVFVCFIVMSINMVYGQQNGSMSVSVPSLGNVEYKMSFDLL